MAANKAKKCEQPGDHSHPSPGCSANDDLEPVFMKYGVDIYWAGHIHFYNRFAGPLYKGVVIANGTTNPAGPMYACTGNGGPPSAMGCTCEKPGLCETCIQAPYSYTRLTVHNATDLLWEQISNKDNTVIDTWTMYQEKHGEFPIPPTTFNCDSPSNGMCKAVMGASGQFKDKASCLAAKECQGSWECVVPGNGTSGGTCTHITNSSGMYTSLGSCERAPSCKPAPPPPPLPKPPGAPLPKGLQYECAASTVYSNAFLAARKDTSYDYLKGFTDLSSCQGVCNDLWNGGKDGCLAVEWHGADKHCVVFNGTALTKPQWKAAQTPTADHTYSVCMLAPGSS